MHQQRLGCRRGVRGAGANRRDAIVRFDHISFARKHQDRFAIPDDELRFQAAQVAIGTPLLRQLDRRPPQVAIGAFQLRLELGEERQRIGDRSGKPGQNRAISQRADLACPMLEHDIANGYLPIAGHGDDAVPAHAQDGRAVNRLSIRTRGVSPVMPCHLVVCPIKS
jgi:hypothetical protein